MGAPAGGAASRSGRSSSRGCPGPQTAPGRAPPPSTSREIPNAKRIFRHSGEGRSLSPSTGSGVEA